MLHFIALGRVVLAQKTTCPLFTTTATCSSKHKGYLCEKKKMLIKQLIVLHVYTCHTCRCNSHVTHLHNTSLRDIVQTPLRVSHIDGWAKILEAFFIGSDPKEEAGLGVSFRIMFQTRAVTHGVFVYALKVKTQIIQSLDVLIMERAVWLLKQIGQICKVYIRV